MPHPRLQRAFDQHKDQLALLAPRWGCTDASDVFNLIAACDPSDDPAYGHNKKQHVNWLVGQALRNELYIANLGPTHRALRLYSCDTKAEPLTATTTPEKLHDRYLEPVFRQIEDYLKNKNGQFFWMPIPGFAEYENIKPLFILDRLVSRIDPGAGRNLPHLLRWMFDESIDALHPEDLPQVSEDLKLYQRKRQSITPAERRDLHSYKTYREFGAVMRRYRPESEPHNRQLIEDNAIAAGHAKLVAETDDFRLIHITSIEGAQQLGKGSRWCTRWDGEAVHHNRFNDYKNGLLYLRLFEANTVQQLHFGYWQFMDVEDVPLTNWVPYARSNPTLYAALQPFALAALTSGELVDEAFSRLPRYDRDRYVRELFQDVVSFARGNEQLERAVAANLPHMLAHPLASSLNLMSAAICTELCADIPVLWNEYREHSDWHRIAMTRCANKAQPDACERLLKVFARDPKTKKIACAVLPEVISFLLEERLTDDAKGIWKLVDYCKSDKDYAKAVNICSTRGLQVTHGVAERLASRLVHKIRQRRQPD